MGVAVGFGVAVAFTVAVGTTVAWAVGVGVELLEFEAIATHPSVSSTNTAKMPTMTHFRLKPNIFGSDDELYFGCCSHGIDAAAGAAYGGDEAALTNALPQLAQNSASGGFSPPQFRQYFWSAIKPRLHVDRATKITHRGV